MASLGDLRNALASAIAATIYPGIPVPIISIPGVFKIVPGWPLSSDLSLMKLTYPPQGVGNAVIAVQDTANRDVTRFLNPIYLVQKGVPTLIWTQSADGRTVTLSGTISVPQNVAIVLAGATDYTYVVQSTDTLQTIVNALGALISPTVSVTVGTDSLYFPEALNAIDVVARVGAVSRYLQLTGQYRATVCVALWCADDATRTAIVNTVKPALDTLKRFALADGTGATMGTGREITVVDMEGMGVQSTRLMYLVDYSSAETILAPEAIVFRTKFLGPTGAVLDSNEA